MLTYVCVRVCGSTEVGCGSEEGLVLKGRAYGLEPGLESAERDTPPSLKDSAPPDDGRCSELHYYVSMVTHIQYYVSMVGYSHTLFSPFSLFPLPLYLLLFLPPSIPLSFPTLPLPLSCRLTRVTQHRGGWALQATPISHQD